ncbi:acyl carrier protein [Planktothrix sp. FACHB-1355]|uniref:Acyl carrier protein n=1 Tax=Aerosakkonema funiforme FACHB-1375 TaxID=2949571 RepID=A0A926VGG2_9CYAN|nr:MULTISPECIES: acyl carrier protein [Oscillatoriales]MBD2183268.1 acyl carrier protein [Aerosakkonema funiforme FACHB-1375]MBD3560742.1 acyl carrier protein [Planktothrix sp. FACHB-1355]
MQNTENNSTLISRDEIESRVISVLEEMTADWDMDFSGGINSQTRLMEDLAFESIDVVQLVVSLEKNFARKDIPFEKLFMQEGDYVDDLLVTEVIDFLHKHLNNRS